jgi:hypothetical protein
MRIYRWEISDSCRGPYNLPPLLAIQIAHLLSDFGELPSTVCNSVEIEGARRLFDHDDLSHPSPFDDRVIGGVVGEKDIRSLLFEKHYRSGFCSLYDMRNWFDKDEIALMELLGFSLSHYDVDDKYVVRFWRQCIFSLSHAKKIVEK